MLKEWAMMFPQSRFRQHIMKLAGTSVGDDEDQMVSGQQSDDVPELLQPDEGKGQGPRGEHESMSSGAEKAHTENREGGYLAGAFERFNSGARQSGAELSNLLDNYGPKAVVSRAMPEAGVSKLGSADLGAFRDELDKIAVSEK